MQATEIRPSQERGSALTVILIGLVVVTVILTGFLIISNTSVQRARTGRDKKISFNRADVGIKYAEDTVQKYINEGLKATFRTLNADGSTNKTEYDLAVQIFEGGINGDSYGLVHNDLMDLLYIGNGYAYYDPMLRIPAGLVPWFKYLGSQRPDDYVYFQFQTKDYPDADRFSYTAMFAPKDDATQDADKVITAPYRYVVAAVGAGHVGNWPPAPATQPVHALLDSVAASTGSPSLDLAPFQATNYNGLLNCFDDRTFSKTYSEEEGFLVLRGDFSVRIFPPDQIASDFLPAYPPPGSPYNYRPQAKGIDFDPVNKRLVIAVVNGLEIIDTTTGENTLIPIPGVANKFEEGVTFCNNYTKVCIPNRDGDLIVADVDPASASFSYQTIDTGAYPGDTYIDSKGDFAVYTGPNGPGIFNAQTDSMVGGVSLGNCSAVTTSPSATDPLFYVGCGTKLYSINPSTGSSTVLIDPLPTNTKSAVLGPNNQLYLTDSTETTLTTVNISTGAVLSTIALPFESGDISKSLSADGKTLRMIGFLENGAGNTDDEYYVYSYDVSGSVPSLFDVMPGPVRDPKGTFIGPDGSVLVVNYHKPGDTGATATRFLPPADQLGMLCDKTLSGVSI